VTGRTRSTDLLIIGCGPAGMRAAVTASACGLATLVIDEGAAPGGQLLRGAADGPLAAHPAFGREYSRGVALVDAFRRSSAQLRSAATVFMIEPEGSGGFAAGIAEQDGSAEIVEARGVIIATGAHERPVPIPGWTLPGVMTAGAAQTMLKSSAVVPQAPLVLAGSGPLLLLLAAQYARLGVGVDAILDTTPAGNLKTALPSVPAFLASGYMWKGLRLLAAARRSTRIVRGVSGLEAIGRDRLEGVAYVAAGRRRERAASALLLHVGVVPQVNLAMASGVQHAWNAGRSAFEPICDARGESSVPGLFVAGDAAGVFGADAAEAAGEVAALAAAARQRQGDRAALAGRLGAAEARLRRLRRGRSFIDALYRPAQTFLTPADDVTVCRCEAVSAGRIRESVRLGARGPNQCKAFTRAGMGPCQARMCGLTINAIIAAETAASPESVGYMRLRAPVKPITVAQMAALAPPDEAPTG
jgi:thioredoxin reductase/bacterioferritin-associated ferredoxin